MSATRLPRSCKESGITLETFVSNRRNGIEWCSQGRHFVPLHMMSVSRTSMCTEHSQELWAKAKQQAKERRATK